MFSEELMEALLEGGEVDTQLIYDAIRKGTLALEFTPVLIGSAYKNKGVQTLLDAVESYLALSYRCCQYGARLIRTTKRNFRSPTMSRIRLIMLAFKLEDGRYGQLTYIRTYQGTLTKGDTVFNRRTGKKVKVGRLCRMHSNEMEEIESCGSGDIVALFGIDCASGDTFTSEGISCSMTSMHIPEPVISLAVIPADNKAQINMSKALESVHQRRSDIQNLC